MSGCEQRVTPLPGTRVGSTPPERGIWLGRFGMPLAGGRKLARFFCSALICALFLGFSGFSLAEAAEPVPPAPPRYFNDYAGVVSPDTARELNQKLEDFEKATSSQILVVIYPRLPRGAALEDWTIRAASAWKAGQKAKDNGAILFVFVQDRLMRIEVGYGLEGAVPDALAHRIIDEEIKPAFQRGDYTGGLTAGVTALMQAARGEYKGTGRTVADQQKNDNETLTTFLIFLGIFALLALFSWRRRGTTYNRSGRSVIWGGWPGMWRGGGGFGGGWSGGGGGGGFSGGGGRFGGGGASGSW